MKYNLVQKLVFSASGGNSGLYRSLSSTVEHLQNIDNVILNFVISDYLE